MEVEVHFDDILDCKQPEKHPVTIQYKVSFAYQIVNGMKHLSDNGIVHPDLALRNCYLDTNYQVKISDGALSQCFYQECYHTVRGTVRPVRWAAIETLQEGLCTSRSNVWSYGVTVWELMTLARLPYLDEVDQNRGILTHLLMQNRLAKPDDCPDNIYSIMSDCWKTRPEERPNFEVVHSLLHEINNKYTAIQSTAPPTTHGLSEINYSTFGKDLRCHDAPPLETASVSLSRAGSLHRRAKSAGGSLRGSMPRSPATSQRNSQNLLGVDNMSDARLSITFSILSNENELDNSGSESEAEESKGLSFEIPSFLTTGQEPPGLYPTPVYTGGYPRAESPMDMVSTFLGGARPSRTSPHDQTDSAPSSTYPTHSSPSTPVPPIATPPSITTRRPSCDTTSFTSSPNGPRNSNDVPTPPPFSGSTSPDMVPPAVSVTPSNQDTISKPSTPDSFTTYSSGHHSTPSSHIPGIPSSTYNNTSVSIDDIKLRNKSLLTTNSSHAGGASKSDSGIRSDEDVESVLSNGGQSSEARTPAAVGRHQDVQKKDSEVSLGIAGLSGDLMATFASWGKN